MVVGVIIAIVLGLIGVPWVLAIAAGIVWAVIAFLVTPRDSY